MFHRSTRGDYRSVRTEHSEKQSHLGAVFPEGESGPFFFAHCPFLREYSPGKEITMQNEKILAYLEGSCLGKANRASGTELARTLHISGTCLRKQVNRLRCKEHPIASDRSGYFYATNAGEVYDTIRQLKQMVAGLEAAISGLERSMERFREHGEAGHG